MARIYRTSIKNNQSKEDSTSNLGVNRKPANIKKARKLVENNSQIIKRSDNWNINSILSNILAYTNHKDLIEFNTVCKKWNHLTTSIIHKSIKLQRSRAIKNKCYDKNLNKTTIADLEVIECIKNNSKHAQLVKEFKLNEKLEPQRAIEFFETFKFITNLTIDRLKMSQDQFLGMIHPLNFLEELNLSCLTINKIVKNKFYTNAVQLPPTLKKLSFEAVNLINNPQLFNQTINSHSNLVEFKFKMYNQTDILEPFLKNYPTLKIFEYDNQMLENPQDIISIFESNPQLLALRLTIKCWSNLIANAINHNLINLEEFRFTEPLMYHEDSLPVFFKFSQHTKIKILNLTWDRLSECSLNSILLNCPYLEDLSLVHTAINQVENPVISLKLPKSKIKKLTISCRNLNESSLDSILLNCPLLEDIDIQLPFVWKDWMNLIGKRCTKLQKLKVSMPVLRSGVDPERTFQETFQRDILVNNYSAYANTLTSLTLNQFDFHFAKEEHFNSFNKLKSIYFPCQRYSHSYVFHPKIDFNKDLWPNYRINIRNQNSSVDVELIKNKY
ncbi:hypothetical protein CONCODRAFT_80635, partial [Conidiobolus coronatus NRRL 28638]